LCFHAVLAGERELRVKSAPTSQRCEPANEAQLETELGKMRSQE
jgi:hypothetical protein